MRLSIWSGLPTCSSQAWRLRQLLIRPAQIDDTAAPEAGLGPDQGVHLRPQPQRLDRQRQFPRVAAHFAAPAPVAAGLLAADLPFFAQHHRDALTREEERGADADDAAANDDDLGRGGLIRVACDWIEGRGHAGSELSMLIRPTTRADRAPDLADTRAHGEAIQVRLIRTGPK